MTMMKLRSLCLLLSAVFVASHLHTLPLVPHHVQKQRRRQLTTTNSLPLVVERPSQRGRRTEQAVQMSALFQGYGTHYVDLWVGSPEPQRQTVIVDTGSGVTAFPCEECTNKCGVPDYHIDQLFYHSKSETFEVVPCEECLRGRCSSNTADSQCHIHMSYAEGSSWAAYESRDTCYVGGLHTTSVKDDNAKNNDDLDPFHAPAFAFDLQFGCQTSITGLFITQLADGIMGMDRAPAAFYEQIYQAHKVPNRSFSLCFWRQDDASLDGTEAGALTLGGADERLHKTPMLRTPLVTDGGFYGVHIRAMYLREGGTGESAMTTDPSKKIIQIENAEAILNTQEVIVDSGTTDTYLARALDGPFREAFKEMTGETYSHKGISMTKEELNKKYPTILFQLSGNEEFNKKVEKSFKVPVTGLAGDLDPKHPYDVILAFPPSHYFEYDTDKKVWIARFYLEEGGGGVLGANAMMGHNVLFDVDGSELGWAESDCDYTGLVSQYYHMDGAPTPSRVDPSTPSDGYDESGDSNDIVSAPVPGNFPSPSPPSVPSGASPNLLQIALVLCVGVAVVYVGLRIARVKKTAQYQVGPSELELHDMDEDDFDVQYRDHPAANTGTGYEDDEVEGTMA